MTLCIVVYCAALMTFVRPSASWSRVEHRCTYGVIMHRRIAHELLPATEVLGLLRSMHRRASLGEDGDISNLLRNPRALSAAHTAGQGLPRPRA